MQTRTSWRIASAALSLALLARAPAAFAHGATPSLDGAPTPPLPPGDGAKAQALIADVESRAKDPEAAKVVAEPIAKARLVLERARGARMSGDLPHAKMLEAYGLEIAETARDLERAATAEAAAMSAGQKAKDAATRVDRARTLLEETQARRGRAGAELELALEGAKTESKDAADAEQKRIEKPSKKGSDAKKPKSDKTKPAGSKQKKAPR